MKYTGLIVLLVVLIGGASLFGWFIGVKRQGIALGTQFEAQAQVVENQHDNMWKTLKEQFNIKDEYQETFISGLEAVASGRTGGSLFKSSTESQAQLGLSEDMYKELMRAVEGKRNELKRTQDKWVDVYRELDRFHKDPIYSIVVGPNPYDEPLLITSTNTKNAVETGVDDGLSFN